MQKQLDTSKKQKAAAEHTQAKMADVVADLEIRLKTAQADAAELQKQAESVNKQASAEVAELRRLEEQAMSGKMSLRSAIEAVEKTAAELPQVENAQQRLLGIKMGADVRLLDAGNGLGDRETPVEWVPSVGDPVLVRSPSSSQASQVQL